MSDNYDSESADHPEVADEVATDTGPVIVDPKAEDHAVETEVPDEVATTVAPSRPLPDGVELR